ncbi:DALR anticodon-binding domain-containing protein [Nocardiopsis sp. NPDC006198]|uniref:DALR anticodon-binding domain-containing protein n=1 Tax=Nocardiopsis sp. NPDC006198 TaxID=3154472 RepID=UPI0033AFC209
MVEPAERRLARELASFPEAMGATPEYLQPHRLAVYLFEPATAFSGFYEQCPVLTSGGTVRESRLALSAHTAAVLERGLDLLGIQSPQRL